MVGGEDGDRGVNYFVWKMGDGFLRWIFLGGSQEVDFNVGDCIMICIFGGGGYGKVGVVEDLGLLNGNSGVNGYVNKKYVEYVLRVNGSLREYEFN